MILKFPGGDYLDIPEHLKGKGIPGIADNSAYEVFFEWRDRLYTNYRKRSSKPSSNSNPTTIDIE
jgi:glutathione S-transferase